MHGLEQKKAAAAAGMNERALSRALARDHVQAWKRELLQAQAAEWGLLSISLTAQLMTDPKTPPATRLEAQREMRRITGIDVGDRAEIGQTTRLVIEVKHSADDASLTIDQSAKTVRAKEIQPIRADASNHSRVLRALGSDDQDADDVGPVIIPEAVGGRG